MESGHSLPAAANAEPDNGMSKSGTVLQRREDKVNHGPTIKLKVSYGSSHYEIHVPAHSTFGEIKMILAQEVGLEPEEQRVFFRGRETQDDENLHTTGVKNNSKLLLMERQVSKEKKLEKLKKTEEMNKASEAVARVRLEVDKLNERVTAVEMAVHGGTKVGDREFAESTELLMRQLLKLDGIEAEGEARAQRKAEVLRVQSLVDSLDALKTKNLNL